MNSNHLSEVQNRLSSLRSEYDSCVSEVPRLESTITAQQEALADLEAGRGAPSSVPDWLAAKASCAARIEAARSALAACVARRDELRSAVFGEGGLEVLVERAVRSALRAEGYSVSQSLSAALQVAAEQAAKLVALRDFLGEKDAPSLPAAVAVLDISRASVAEAAQLWRALKGLLERGMSDSTLATAESYLEFLSQRAQAAQ